MATRIIRLRRDDSCAKCGIALPATTRALWDSALRTTTCLTCSEGNADASEPRASVGPPTTSPSFRSGAGQAGASAQREYERRHQRREAAINDKWGRLAGIVQFLSDDPQSIRAWRKGSDGERRLAESLMRRLGDRAVFLNDRKVPRTRKNIDHIAIAPSGVWVIDAKTYKGRVERRDKGSFFKADCHLYVNRRDRTKLVDGLAWQVDAVRSALGDIDVSIKAALCFVDAEWSLFPKPFQLHDVWVTWGAKLAELIAAPGPLDKVAIPNIANYVAKALPPAVPSP